MSKKEEIKKETLRKLYLKEDQRLVASGVVQTIYDSTGRNKIMVPNLVRKIRLFPPEIGEGGGKYYKTLNGEKYYFSDLSENNRNYELRNELHLVNINVRECRNEKILGKDAGDRMGIKNRENTEKLLEPYTWWSNIKGVYRDVYYEYPIVLPDQWKKRCIERLKMKLEPTITGKVISVESNKNKTKEEIDKLIKLELNKELDKYIEFIETSFILLDFYIPGLKLAIEADSRFHNSDISRIKDKVRDELLKEFFGITVYRLRSSSNKLEDIKDYKKKLKELQDKCKNVKSIGFIKKSNEKLEDNNFEGVWESTRVIFGLLEKRLNGKTEINKKYLTKTNNKSKFINNADDFGITKELIELYNLIEKKNIIII